MSFVINQCRDNQDNQRNSRDFFNQKMQFHVQCATQRNEKKNEQKKASPNRHTFYTNNEMNKVQKVAKSMEKKKYTTS